MTSKGVIANKRTSLNKNITLLAPCQLYMQAAHRHKRRCHIKRLSMQVTSKTQRPITHYVVLIPQVRDKNVNFVIKVDKPFTPTIILFMAPFQGFSDFWSHPG